MDKIRKYYSRLCSFEMSKVQVQHRCSDFDEIKFIFIILKFWIFWCPIFIGSIEIECGWVKSIFYFFDFSGYFQFSDSASILLKMLKAAFFFYIKRRLLFFYIKGRLQFFHIKGRLQFFHIKRRLLFFYIKKAAFYSFISKGGFCSFISNSGCSSLKYSSSTFLHIFDFWLQGSGCRYQSCHSAGFSFFKNFYLLDMADCEFVVVRVIESREK